METHEGCVLRFYVECVTGTECFHLVERERQDIRVLRIRADRQHVVSLSIAFSHLVVTVWITDAWDRVCSI